MKLYYNIVLNISLLDVNKLQILGVKPSLLYYIIFSSLFILCYLFVQPLIALLVARHTVNLLTYLMSSLLIIVSSLILLQLPDLLPTSNQNFPIEQSPLVLKNALLAVGTLGIIIAGFYYTKHLLNLKKH
ncbi:MAG TPA: hypothetical protein VK056_00855 [Bacillota bacterium]|nr:hypothetical protein [Bacillota bacterium]